MNKDLPKLLRAIANGTDAKDRKHDIILNSAAAEIERLWSPTYIQGDGGWYVISLGSPRFCFFGSTLEEAQALAKRAVAHQ